MLFQYLDMNPNKKVEPRVKQPKKMYEKCIKLLLTLTECVAVNQITDFDRNAWWRSRQLQGSNHLRPLSPNLHKLDQMLAKNGQK